MKIRKLPSVKVLREYFDHDGEGNLVSAIDINFANCSRVKGQILGSINLGRKPYLYVRFKGQGYLVHRILFKLYHNKFDETLQIDHINGKHSDNKKSNLRLVNNSENQRNRKSVNRNNTSGTKGIRYDTIYKLWVARIGYQSKNIYLGAYKTQSEAMKARLTAEKKYHYYVV